MTRGPAPGGPAGTAARDRAHPALRRVALALAVGALVAAGGGVAAFATLVVADPAGWLHEAWRAAFLAGVVLAAAAVAAAWRLDAGAKKLARRAAEAALVAPVLTMAAYFVYISIATRCGGPC